MATDRELLDLAESLLQQGRQDDARLVLQRYQQRQVVEPMAREARGIPQVPERAAVEAGAAARATEEAQKALEPRLTTSPDVIAEREAETERRRQEALRETRRPIPAGQLEPVEVTREGLPSFRPTRVTEEIGRVVAPVEGEGVLLPEEFEARQRAATVPEADLPAPLDPRTLRPRIVRVYTDPETGERRTPTLSDEFTEAFALQTERSEQALRQTQAELQAEREAVRKRIEAGEDVPFYERHVGPLISGVLTRPEEGAGVVETPLGAALRSLFSWSSAAAAEGYFRGLGYEVDAEGQPVDPNDFGLGVAKARRALGIPEVLEPTAPVNKVYRALGIPELPAVVVPLPGVATESMTRKRTTFDPEGRRRVEDVQVPSPFSGQGWLKAEATRIAQNVAKGRTWGDEYLDSPAVRDYYADATGDPDHAYYAGMVPEVLMPSLSLPLRLVAKGATGAADLAGLTRAARDARKVKRAEETVHNLRTAVTQAEALGEDATEVRKSLDAAQGRLDGLLEAAGDYDSKLLGKIGEKAASTVLGDTDAKRQAVAAIQAGDGPQTIGEVVSRVSGAIGDEDAARAIGSLVYKNVPGDFVMLTDAIAVPRAEVKAAREVLKQTRQELFVKPTRTVVDDLFGLAERLPEGPVRENALRIARQALDEVDEATTAGSGFGGLSRRTRGKVQQAARAAARELDIENPAEFARRFDQRKPVDVFENTSMALRDELARFDSWDKVPADLRRAALDAHDVRMVEKFGKRARLASDTTRAQLWFKTAEQRLGLRGRLAASRLFDSPEGRRYLASRGRLQTETASAAQVGRELAQAGSTALRTLREKLLRAVEEAGDYDTAVNNVLRSQMQKAGEEVEEVWKATLGHLYGEDLMERVLGALKSPRTGDAIVALEDGKLVQYPTAASLRKVDELLSSEKGGNILPGDRLVRPDILGAMLKTILEDGIRKNIITSRKLPFNARQLKDARLLGESDELTQAELAERVRQLLPFPAEGRKIDVPPELQPATGRNAIVYDKAAGEVERQLTLDGQGLFRMLDNVPVRQRGDVLRMARDAADMLLRTGRRNVLQRFAYGYIVPNLPVQLGRLLQLAVVPMVTIGARNTLEAFGRAGQRALSTVTRRRLHGGGITDANGVYYSPTELQRLGESYGLGASQLDTERVGTLAFDLARDARKLALRQKAGPVVDSIEMLNPADRGYFLRLAESLELNFRQSVFEMALARGDAPTDAAELARKSQFDYAEVPDVVKETLGRYVGESALLYKLSTEGLEALARKPGAARTTLKGLRAKAEVQDPYNLHGDKALKSLGIVTAPDGDEYYLPSLPFMMPIETGISMVRNADLLVDNMRFASQELGGVGEGAREVTGPEAALRFGGEVVAPAVLRAFERFTGQGDSYSAQSVEDAGSMTDTKAAWALALLAHNRDPEHTSGAWSFFERVVQPEVVEPPAELASEKYPGAWRRQPPEGVPHVLWDVVDGEPVYYSFEPSEAGLRNLRVLRTLTPDGIERVLPLYNVLQNPKEGRNTPRSVYGSPLLPETPAEALGELVLPRTGTLPGELGVSEQARAVGGQLESAIE